MTSLNHRPLLVRLLCSVLAMFGFGFALVPLYDVFCQITGINGKTRSEAATAARALPDQQRMITVQFLARPDKGMPWVFEPEVKQVEVHPGQISVVHYQASNPTGNSMVAQAVPSVSPGTAALYFNKMECFCFNQQRLAGGAGLMMPLRFYIDPALPADIQTITLSYTLYDVTQRDPIQPDPTEKGD